MNWKQSLFKPKWQHNNPDIRLAAVESEQDPRLIAGLAEIAAKDADSRVRCAAIKRMHELQNLLTLYATETDADARSLLEDRIRQLASNTSETRPALALRLQVANSTTNRALIEHLASHAPEAELRRAALLKVERQGFLGDCCIGDNDAENRRVAAGRITQLTTLKRVIDGLRKRDKDLYAQLQSRLHQELLDKADPGAVRNEALHICTGLEELAIAPEPRDTTAIESAHCAWKRVAPLVSSDMTERYQRVCIRLSASPADDSEPPVPPAVKTPATQPPASEEPQLPSHTTPASAALAQAANDIRRYHEENSAQPRTNIVKRLRKRLEKNWDQNTHADDQAHWAEASRILQQLEERIESLDRQREKLHHKAQKLLAQLQQELDDGKLHNALLTRASLQQLSKTKDRGNDRAWKDIFGSLTGMQGRLRELREWHHWSNNKIRKRLIAEMELLPAASDLHPDALIDRIKSLQAEWKTLEESEQIPGEKHFAAAPWMWRKFNAAGHTAFDTARPFLDKRSEIQSREAQSLATFIAELEQLAAVETPDWAVLGKGLNRGRRKLRELNNVPAKQRQKLARKLKSALDKANAVMQEHYQAVEKDKMKLIRAASQLIHLPERDDAIAQAKALQAQWKDAGSLWRGAEQKLWMQFREHVDPLFEQLKEQQASVRAADKEKLAAQHALCDELKAILKSAEDLPAQHGRVQGLQDRWRDIQHADRKLLHSFQSMVTDYQQQVENIQLQKINVDRDRWWVKSGLLHTLANAAETGPVKDSLLTKVQKAWPQQSSDEPVEASMDQQLGKMLAGEPAVSEESDRETLETQARSLCIRLEFIAGLPSPKQDRDLRMKYQVDRLAESMSGGVTRLPATDEANEAEREWLGMYALPDPVYNEFYKRVKQALATIIVIK